MQKKEVIVDMAHCRTYGFICEDKHIFFAGVIKSSKNLDFHLNIK
jgi:hypothetical protein